MSGEDVVSYHTEGRSRVRRSSSLALAACHLEDGILPESLQVVGVENLREDGGLRTKNRSRSNKTMQNDVKFRSKTFVQAVRPGMTLEECRCRTVKVQRRDIDLPETRVA